MKNILLLFVLITCNFLNGQMAIDENKFELKFKKAIKNSRHFEVHTSRYFIKVNKGEKKIQIRFKLKSLSYKKEIFDPNKFYLISHEYKKRVRPIDIKSGTIGFRRLVSVKLTKGQEHYGYTYKPDIKDTFLDYKIEGYEDIEDALNFGTKRKPNFKEFYFDQKKLRSKTIDVYFAVPTDLKKGVIYYGNHKLADFRVK